MPQSTTPHQQEAEERELGSREVAERLGVTVTTVRLYSVNVQEMTPEEVAALPANRLRGRKEVLEPIGMEIWKFHESEVERFASLERLPYRAPVGRDPVAVRTTLERLRELLRSETGHDEMEEDRLILEANAAGASYPELGEVLGITRQAVHQRMRKLGAVKRSSSAQTKAS